MSDERLALAMTTPSDQFWARQHENRDPFHINQQGELVFAGIMLASAAQRHRLAALCLYGQPFGFNDFHPALLRTVADTIERYDDERAEELRWLALRIAALLPPEGK